MTKPSEYVEKLELFIASGMQNGIDTLEVLIKLEICIPHDLAFPFLDQEIKQVQKNQQN